MGNLDHFDPAIGDALAAGREIILFDNAGVGRSAGTAPGTIADMAADAASFIEGPGLTSVDVFPAKLSSRYRLRRPCPDVPAGHGPGMPQMPTRSSWSFSTNSVIRPANLPAISSL